MLLRLPSTLFGSRGLPSCLLLPVESNKSARAGDHSQCECNEGCNPCAVRASRVAAAASASMRARSACRSFSASAFCANDDASM